MKNEKQFANIKKYFFGRSLLFSSYLYYQHGNIYASKNVGNFNHTVVLDTTAYRFLNYTNGIL